MSDATPTPKKHRIVKVALVTSGIAILILMAYTWLGLHAMDIYMWSQERAAIAYDKEILASQEKLAQLERSDTYGSTTPEGTLLLLIDALAHNDPVLASKYYYVLDQETALKDYQAMLAKDGSLDRAEQYYRNLNAGKIECNDIAQGCTFSHERIRSEDESVVFPNTPDPVIFEKGSVSLQAVDLKFYTNSGVWKVHE
jgi:fructose-specific component phosphotransferase system IIB-like protein